MPMMLEPYNAAWKIEFEKLAGVLYKAMHGLEIEIQHVGSTAIQGLSAKPILDIDIIIHHPGILTTIENKLKALGYISKGTQGIAGRYAFRQTDENTPVTNAHQRWQQHHLYVCLANSLALKNHLLFRDALRNDKGLLEKYERLKLSLISHTSMSRQKYTTQKTAFILEVLAAHGLTPTEIAAIRLENQ